MKKYILAIVLVFFTGLSAFSQNLDSLMNDLAKNKNAIRVVYDRVAIAEQTQTQIKGQMDYIKQKISEIKDTAAIESFEQMGKWTRDSLSLYTQKIDSSVIIIIQNPDSGLIVTIKNFKDSDRYITSKVEQLTALYIRTITHNKIGNITTEIYRFILPEESYSNVLIFGNSLPAIIRKDYGKFSDEDLRILNTSESVKW